MSNDLIEMILINDRFGNGFMVYKEDVIKSKMYVFSDITEVFKNEDEVKAYYEKYSEEINLDNRIKSYEEFSKGLDYDIIVYYRPDKFFILNYDFSYYEELPYEEIMIKEVYYKYYDDIEIYVLKDINTGIHYFCNSYFYTYGLLRFDVIFEKTEFCGEEDIKKAIDILKKEQYIY